MLTEMDGLEGRKQVRREEGSLGVWPEGLLEERL